MTKTEYFKKFAEILGVKWSENMDHEQILAEYFRNQGKRMVHICPDANHMAIHEESSEFEACHCDKATLK